MRITPELRTKITEHFYYYRDDTQNESIIDESPKDINETSYYEQPYARDDLRTRIRDEIFYIDQAAWFGGREKTRVFQIMDFDFFCEKTRVYGRGSKF